MGQAKGTMSATMGMLVFWSFGAYTYIRPQQSEMPDLYCIFSIVLGWMGLIMFFFYGVMSQRFRKGISGKYAKYQQDIRYAMSGKQKNTDDATSELGSSSDNAESFAPSRPATAKSSLNEEPIENQEDGDQGEVAEDTISKKSSKSNKSQEESSE